MSAQPSLVLVRAASAAATATTSHSSDLDPIVLGIGIVVLLVLVVTNSRRRQRMVAGQQAEIEVGSMVLTRFGLIAQLVDRTDDYVVLQLEDGTRARFVPQIIGEAWHEPVPDDAAGAELPADGDPPTAG